MIRQIAHHKTYKHRNSNYQIHTIQHSKTMYEWNFISYHIMMVINVLLIQLEGYSFEAYQVSDMCFVMLYSGDTWTLFEIPTHVYLYNGLRFLGTNIGPLV
jgi:hypothetical protein